jgi:hypothetical protein
MKRRTAAISVSGVIAVLLLAIILAAGGFFNWLSGSADDLSWLTSAMSACDTNAEKDTSTLRFLVIPLTLIEKDDKRWLQMAINQGGNAILLGSNDALEGIKSGTLRIYAGEYDFRVLDEGANRVYKWAPADGVTNYSTSNAGSITQFKMQFLTRKNSSNAEWSASFMRQIGTCYWVSAIIGD